MVYRLLPKLYDVITVGSATVDCFAILAEDFKKIRHGDKILLNDIQFRTGGGATNVAVGLRRLGIRTAFLGELGRDHSAQQILDELKEERVAVINRQRSKYPTSYSIILDTEKMDRAILAYKGASNFLHYYEFPKKLLSTRWFYFASMVDVSFGTLEKLADFAVRNRIKVFFNPSSYMAEKGKKYLDRVLQATNIICLNKEEAQSLLGSRSADVKALLKGLRSLSPRMEIVIITDGAKGLHVFDGKEVYDMVPHKIKCVDTTGAGDSFGTGFLAGLIMNDRKDLRFAMHLGLVNAESVIQHVGAKTGLLRKNQALSLVREQ
ncbi:TPA: carbohydrate kinase family protein [Candidatus Woesearchaeota archaeon]|nr:carbohydrate kinase family protein [Candidatus Woesearchaeota archaeon]